MGAAGDMLMSALLELCENPPGFIDKLNGIGIPKVEIRKDVITKCGILGTHVNVLVDGVEENGHMHEHHHEHHHHTGMNEIRTVINGLAVSDKVKKDALNVYELIAEAESFAHGRAVGEIHFHEVGTMDAVADIVGVCMLIEELKPEKVIASRVHVGSGNVSCAHGILPVPAPATARILRGVPTFGGEVDGELCTPTGAALVKYFAEEFTDKFSITAEKIGYGMGKRHFFDQNGNEILSCVRAVWGENEGKTEKVAVLSCNIDDMTGEQTGFALERIAEGGALDAFTSPVYMKKNRPGILLTVICKTEDERRMTELIFKHTTTIGLRKTNAERYVLERRKIMADTDYGQIKAKRSFGFGTVKTKAEYEDLRKTAIENDIAIGDIKLNGFSEE